MEDFMCIESVRFGYRFSKRLLPYPQIASQYRFVKMVPIYDNGNILFYNREMLGI